MEIELDNITENLPFVNQVNLKIVHGHKIMDVSTLTLTGTKIITKTIVYTNMDIIKKNKKRK